MRRFLFFVMVSMILGEAVRAQNTDSAPTTKSKKKKIELTSILMYSRVIRDAPGNVRFDVNVVPDIKLNKAITLELGYRHGSQTFKNGETPQFGAYDHYKIELQTRRVKTFRMFARLSDNIDRSPVPQYSRSNYVLAVDGKPKIYGALSATLAYGYVLSFQQTGNVVATPITRGKSNNYPIFKVGLQYNLWNKGRIAYDYGSYDTFNPYLLKDPFTQITFEYEISKRVDFYSYYRREFLNTYGQIYNRFFTAGVTVKMNKK